MSAQNRGVRRTKIYSEHTTLGLTFFEEHRKMAAEHHIPEDHVIVDRVDYERVMRFLHENHITAQDILNIKTYSMSENIVNKSKQAI